MSVPLAPCPNLAAIGEIYDEDKRVTVHVPGRDFAVPVSPGDDVVLVGAVGYNGKPVEGTARASGRIKRVLYEVELDLSTLEEPEHPGQGTLGEVA